MTVPDKFLWNDFENKYRSHVSYHRKEVVKLFRRKSLRDLNSRMVQDDEVRVIGDHCVCYWGNNRVFFVFESKNHLRGDDSSFFVIFSNTHRMLIVLVV
ncbi:hypothetical protein BH09BAC3_BH09BAC3_09060 [soil metagenome]